MAGNRRDAGEPPPPSPPAGPAPAHEGERRRPYQGKHRAPPVNPRTLRSGLINRLRDQSPVPPQPTTDAPGRPASGDQTPPNPEPAPDDDRD